MTRSIFSEKYERFRQLLIKARKEAPLTQVELADKLSRPQSYVSKFERGERRLDVIEFFELADALDVDPFIFLRDVYEFISHAKSEVARGLVDVQRIERLREQVGALTDGQFARIENIIIQLLRPSAFQRDPNSDLVTDCVLHEFGDALRIHHCFSVEPFAKDKFEYALVNSCSSCGVSAAMAPRGNQGYDVTIGGATFSLKTEASAGIKSDLIHISKFMELGKGKWTNKIKDLSRLRDRFLDHLQDYNRILTLRRLKMEKPGSQHYELVEIPKQLLMEAERGEFEMKFDSKQNPKPGYCTVTDASERVKFQLFFDGGTERKLQIKEIDKRLCILHATWEWDDGYEGRRTCRTLKGSVR